MKVVLFALFCAVLFSCKKDNEINSASYIGTWELAEATYNGIIYTKTDYPPGNENTVTFKSDGTLIMTVKQADTSYTNEYAYHLGKGQACGHNEATDTVLYYGETQSEIIYVLDGMLYFESTQCVEAGGSANGFSYRKIK